MRHKIKFAMLSLIIFPYCTDLLAGDYYITQGIKVANHSSQNIFITDPAVSELTNDLTLPGYVMTAVYPDDELTTPSGQKFSHTINIVSAVNYVPICTVTSDLDISTTATHQHQPKSSNESKCQTSVYQSISKDGYTILGFKITVVD